MLCRVRPYLSAAFAGLGAGLLIAAAVTANGCTAAQGQTAQRDLQLGAAACSAGAAIAAAVVAAQAASRPDLDASAPEVR